jgi:hypothetical protein
MQMVSICLLKKKLPVKKSSCWVIPPGTIRRSIERALGHQSTEDV